LASWDERGLFSFNPYHSMVLFSFGMVYGDSTLSLFGLEVIIFGSIQFLLKKVIELNFKKNRNRFKPTGLARFFLFGSVFRFFRFHTYKTETEPVIFFNFNKLNRFFFTVWFFRLFFSSLIGFLVFCSPLVRIYYGLRFSIFC